MLSSSRTSGTCARSVTRLAEAVQLACASTSRRAYATETRLPDNTPSYQPYSPPRYSDRLPPLRYGIRPPSPPSASSSTNEARFAPLEPALQEDIQSIVRSFRAPVRYAFSYGSGVFKQAGYSSTDKPLLDFVFAVTTPVHWHAINLQQYPQHYSLIARILGSRFVSVVQEKMGASCWFNVECEVNGRLIKYGVISIDDLCRDLLDWETLYMAGRMHKPIRVLRDDGRVRLADQVNLTHALRTSLLFLPETFTEAELYRTIAGLSYRGDFRMTVGENPQKVSNIVSAQFERFQALYSPGIEALKSAGVLDWTASDGKRLQQDHSPRARAQLVRKLPNGLRDKLEGHFEQIQRIKEAKRRAAGGEATITATDELAQWTQIVQDPDFTANLGRSLELVVAGPAFRQSLKGIASVGLSKGIRYVGPKLRKRWAAKPSSEQVEAPKQS